MEPCPGRPGVIFTREELPTVVEILGQYVHDSDILHTVNAQEVYRDLVDIRHEKYGYWGGAFVPADEALSVSKILEEQAHETTSDTYMVPGIGVMSHIAAPLHVQARHSFANQIEKAVKKSRTLQS